MILLPTGVKIFVARQPTDLRKSIDGLAMLAREVIRQDPLSGHLFVFVNKAGHRVKILFWDRTGYVIWYKRLERARIRLPEEGEATLELTASKLALVLDGIGWARRRERGSSTAS